MDYVYVQVTGQVSERVICDADAEEAATWVVARLVDAMDDLVAQTDTPDGFQLLDLVQTQRFAHLHMGILLACDSGISLAALSMALRTALGTTGLQVTAQALAPATVQAAKTVGRQHGYVLTVLSQRLSAKVLHGVSRLLSHHGLFVTRSQRLTPLPPLVSPGQSAPAVDSTGGPTESVLELCLQGDASGIERLQQDLVHEAQHLGVDLVLQRDDAQRRHKRLAVFDMDSTLIKTEVIDELAAVAGVHDQVSAITERAMRGEIDFKESFRARMALLKGLPADHLATIAAKLPIMDGARRLFDTLRAYGIKTAIISGGFTYFAHYLQQELGIDAIYANTLCVEADHLTGQVIEPIVDGQQKAQIVKALAAEHNIDLSQVVAVGDGANDLLMLEAVGTGIAFRAKPVVRQSAKLALTTMGLEGVLYLMGLDQRDHHSIY